MEIVPANPADDAASDSTYAPEDDDDDGADETTHPDPEDAALDERIHAMSWMTKREHFVVMQAMASHFQLSRAAVTALGRYALACAPEGTSETNFCVSKYYLDKFSTTLTGNSASNIYYCKECWVKAERGEDGTWRCPTRKDGHGRVFTKFLQNDIEAELADIFSGTREFAHASS